MGTEGDERRFGRVAFVLAVVVGCLSVSCAIYFGLSARRHGHANEPPEATQIAGANEPAIFFPKTDIDFGKMRPGAKKEILVPFENRGNPPLIVRKARSTCACLIASLVDNQLNSGQKGKLELLLIAEAKHGRIEYPAYVESNDPKRPFVKVKAVVTVDSGVTAEPVSIDLGNVTRGSRFKRFVKLRTKTGCMTVNGVKSSSATIKATLARDEDLGLGIMIEGSVGKKVGPLREKVGLMAEESKTPILYVPIKGAVTR